MSPSRRTLLRFATAAALTGRLGAALGAGSTAGALLEPRPTSRPHSRRNTRFENYAIVPVVVLPSDVPAGDRLAHARAVVERTQHGMLERTGSQFRMQPVMGKPLVLPYTNAELVASGQRLDDIVFDQLALIADRYPPTVKFVAMYGGDYAPEVAHGDTSWAGVANRVGGRFGLVLTDGGIPTSQLLEDMGFAYSGAQVLEHEILHLCGVSHVDDRHDIMHSGVGDVGLPMTLDPSGASYLRRGPNTEGVLSLPYVQAPPELARRMEAAARAWPIELGEPVTGQGVADESSPDRVWQFERGAVVLRDTGTPERPNLRTYVVPSEVNVVWQDEAGRLGRPTGDPTLHPDRAEPSVTQQFDNGEVEVRATPTLTQAMRGRVLAHN